ncbi:MAG: UDP-N-acetylglucosamine--N-acetylmuramyl-(pentapeptide) pyrophosphoryl-undecaprenol N-acetylglucosamine transferase [Candidatus Neomarinimicrobiota bacterium]|nr:UDP-N-acetylglucosamine--N-acetylmuramyl-(pentapeptide) pyrophosphoryl-undecaprenol N-acetylglucosamine transferase [Candidatus Neomarinimicrobiota bacterium]
MSTNQNILFCGGGTGGHYYPLMAIKQELDKSLNNKKMYYIGSKYGIESKKISLENIKNLLIPIRGFNRSFSIKNYIRNFLLIFQLLFGFVRVLIFFIMNKPSLVIASGGYSSFLPLQMARMFNIPYFIHEQNSFPGIVTRIFGKKAKIVFLGFDNAKNHLKGVNTIFTGNPIHIKPFIEMNINTDISRKTLLIVGGSQGSEFLNNLISDGIEKNIIPNINIIWLVGENNFDKYEQYNSDSVKVFSFVDNMPYLYETAHLVVSRSGAMTVSELLQFNRPAIFIPFKFAADNHQYHNAKALTDSLSSIIIEEKDITSDLLFKKVDEILNNERVYSSMMNNIRNINKPNSLTIIKENILEHLYAS